MDVITEERDVITNYDDAFAIIMRKNYNNEQHCYIAE